MAAALTGIRVVDLSRVLAGPMCSQILADHGASVVKVEPPAGDDTRTLGPPFNDLPATPPITRRLIAARIASASIWPRRRAGKIVEKLLETADVLIENFLPGTMEKWGLSYEGVFKRTPSSPDLLLHHRLRRRRAAGRLSGL